MDSFGEVSFPLGTEEKNAEKPPLSGHMRGLYCIRSAGFEPVSRVNMKYPVLFEAEVCEKAVLIFHPEFITTREIYQKINFTHSFLLCRLFLI